MSHFLSTFSYSLLQALAWSLIHALWQLSLLFVVYRMVLPWYKNDAAKRHWIGLGTLLVQCIWSTLTLVYQYQHTQATSTTSRISGEGLPHVAMSTTAIWKTATQDSAWTDAVQYWCIQHLDYLVYAWFSGVLFLVVRLMGGYYYVQRLRWKHTQWADDATQQVFDTLLDRLEIPYQVLLRISSKIDTPMTIGFLQPIVLMPFGLLSGLSEQELRAILAHELAHIKRYDYLINLIQSFIEIVFFYHPLVWVISDAVRDDRENACDDWALAVCQHKLHLAKALTLVEHFKLQSSTSLAMSFSGNKAKLLSRVQRILGLKTQQSNSPVGIIAACVCVLLALCSLNFTQVKAQASQVASSLQQLMRPTKTQLPTPKQRTITVVEPQPVSTPAPVLLSVNQDSLQVASHLAAMAILEKQMQGYSEQIRGYSEQINQLSKHIRAHLPSQESIETISKAIQQQGAQLGKLARKQAQISLQLEEEGLSKDERAKLTNEHQQLDNQIKALEEQLKKFSEKTLDMEAHIAHTPIDSLVKLVDKTAVPLQEIAKKLTLHAEAIKAIDPTGKYHDSHKLVYGFSEPVDAPTPPTPPSPPAPPAQKSPKAQ